MIYSMSVGSGLDETPNLYFYTCLARETPLTIFYKTPILSLLGSSLGKYEIVLKPSRKPTCVSVNNYHLIISEC